MLFRSAVCRFACLCVSLGVSPCVHSRRVSRRVSLRAFLLVSLCVSLCACRCVSLRVPLYGSLCVALRVSVCLSVCLLVCTVVVSLGDRMSVAQGESVGLARRGSLVKILCVYRPVAPRVLLYWSRCVSRCLSFSAQSSCLCALSTAALSDNM